MIGNTKDFQNLKRENNSDMFLFFYFLRIFKQSSPFIRLWQTNCLKIKINWKTPRHIFPFINFENPLCFLPNLKSIFFSRCKIIFTRISLCPNAECPPHLHDKVYNGQVVHKQLHQVFEHSLEWKQGSLPTSKFLALQEGPPPFLETRFAQKLFRFF